MRTTFVIEELALGSIQQRDVVLELLENLRQFPVLSHAEAMTLLANAGSGAGADRCCGRVTSG